MPRACSISIQSDTSPRRPALPCTAPASAITRACSASASVSVDLPASGWLMTANVRRRRRLPDDVLRRRCRGSPARRGRCAHRVHGTGVNRASAVTLGRGSSAGARSLRWAAMRTGAFGRAVAVVAADALDDLEEDPGAEHLGEQVQVAAVLVLVVEEPALPHRGEQPRVEVEAGVEVVVVVGRDGEQRRAGRAQGPGGGDDVVGGEGDVLRRGDAGRPVAAAQQRDVERQPDGAVGAGRPRGCAPARTARRTR